MFDEKKSGFIHWYLLQTKYNQENRAAQELKKQNITVFFPQYKIEKLTKGEKITKEEPLFSRYLFVQLNNADTNWTSIRSTRGVSNIVEFGNGPFIVDEAIIWELKKLDPSFTKPYIDIGGKVRVMSGPLKGLIGIYKAPNGLSRSIILMEFMSQNQHLSIDNELLEKK